MRKFLSVLLAAVMVLSVAPVAAFADDSLGFKVVGDTAYIYTADELMALSAALNDGTFEGNVEIMADIDLAGYNWYPIDYYEGAERYTFDGNGHTVSNMTITVNEPKGKDPDDFEIPEADLGFFSDARNADIMNLNVQGTINVERYNDETNIGGLGGDIDSDTVITNCHVDVVITLKTNLYKETYEDGSTRSYTDHAVGGLVGELDDAYIYNSTSKADITVTVDYDEELDYDVLVGGFIGDSEDNEIAGCRAEGSVTVNYDGDVKAGGIIGISEDSIIYSSSTSVDVTVNHRGNNNGTAFIGGIFGETDDVYIYNSFSTSDLVGKIIDINDNYDNEIGGIVGEAEDNDLVIENCYFDGTITGKSIGGGDIGGIVGDLESDVDETINNIWSSCSDIGTDTDNVNGYALPDMASLLNALNENARELDEDGIPHITLWALTKDGRPGVGMIERVIEQPTAELPRFVATRNNGEPTYQWQVGTVDDTSMFGEPVENLAEQEVYDNGVLKTNDITATAKWIQDSTGVWTSQNSGDDFHGSYSYIKFELDLEAGDVIEFQWRVDCEDSYYYEEYDEYDYYDYLAYYLYDGINDLIHEDIISGKTEWETVQHTVSEDGKYYLEFVYEKDWSDTYGDDRGYVRLDFIEHFENIVGANSPVLNNRALDDKWVHCVATYPDGEIVVSDMFKYDYDAINQDELKKPVPVYKDTPGFVLGYDVDAHKEESTTTMVPLFFGTTVRVYDAANGTITPNGIPMIIGGMEMTFKFIPDDGYTVADVLLNGESVGAVEALTIDGFSGYVKLTAVFEPVETEVVEP